jgi:hypothetical protein
VDEFCHLDLKSYGLEQLGSLLWSKVSVESVAETEAPEPPAADIADLESIAREMCLRNGVAESQWHLYVGKALRVIASA